MPRNMVGLLAAAGTAMAALVSLVHGDLVPVMIVGGGSATGLAAWLALPSKNALDTHVFTTRCAKDFLLRA
jgi:hypothetical protein